MFQAVLEAQFVILAVIVSVYFYFKVVVALFMRSAERGIGIPEVSLSDRFAGGLILILILWLGILPAPVFDVVEAALRFFPTPFNNLINPR